ncbi:MAG: hypothetical protein Q9162_004271 [Coniocarpon cinnabarinum]
MAPYYPLYVRRSDGKLQVQVHGTTEQNEPTKDQLNQTANAQGICDFYRLCKTDDLKVLDWRRKLGGMLMKEIGAKEPKGRLSILNHATPRHMTDEAQDRSYILADLPENYRLYEHVKFKANGESSQSSKTSKNHAAGANDRQDAYLYGYPTGRKKRYRSPNEFFPHLLWLVTDEAGDPNNCSCKFCTPEEMEQDKEKEKQPKAAAPAEPADTKQKAPALSRPSDVLKQPPKERKPAVQQPQVQELISPIGRPTSAQQPNAQRPTGKPMYEPQMLPRTRTMEQRLDFQPGKFLYRPGEVVWFKRGMAWGLGVIAKRDNDQKQPSPYRIQPLSHPFHQPNTLDLPPSQLRPWLAWSPPPTTASGLHPSPQTNYQSHSYSTVDWQRYIHGGYGAGDGEVDGSILAACQAETTYTPFDPTGTSPIPNTPQPQGRETHYNGIFIGAEKIWVGDALRLRYHQFPMDIMVLHDIVEQPILNNAGSHAYPANSQTRIILVGDTYSPAIAQLEPQNIPQNDLHLPSRVRSELEFRNKITEAIADPKRRFSSFWRITSKNVRLGMDEIKGRWYESSLLLPILDPQAFAQRQIRGDMADACCYMNGHGDCNKPHAQAPNAVIDPRTSQRKHRAADTRVERREDAFGRAVPSEFKVHKGLDEGRDGMRPGSSSGSGVGDWMDGSSRPASRPGSVMSGVTGTGNISAPATTPSATMDLPGYGQEYSSQELKDSDMTLFQGGSEGLGDLGGQ